MKPATDMSEFTTALAAGGAAAPTDRVAATATTPSRARDFYELTKPRMNFLVVCTTAVGFSMTPHGGHWVTLLHAILRTVLTAASSAILNQVIERDYDALMPRTRNRPIPGGRISVAEATLLGVAFGVVGVAYLAIMVNAVTAALGAFTLASYVWVYTPLKR